MTGVWEVEHQDLYTDIVNTFTDFISEEPIDFEELIVFGSYGRGVATDSSDLDVLIVVSNAESYTDVERRDKFTGYATRLEDEVTDIPSPITEIDVLIATQWTRDRVLRDCIEEVSTSELQDCPCLAYNLTDGEEIKVLHP